jgi:hypothetical protein
MLPSMPRTALRSVARHVSSPSIHARPRPALPPIPIALSPVFSRPNVEPLHVVQCKRLFSSSSIVSSVAANKVLGVAAALKAQEDDAFQVKPEIFDEFSLKGRVGVVCLAGPAGHQTLYPDLADRVLRRSLEGTAGWVSKWPSRCVKLAPRFTRSTSPPNLPLISMPA